MYSTLYSMSSTRVSINLQTSDSCSSHGEGYLDQCPLSATVLAPTRIKDYVMGRSDCQAQWSPRSDLNDTRDHEV